MTAIVVNHIRETYKGLGIAVFYCSYNTRKEQTRENLLAGIVRQLVNQKRTLPEELLELYETCEKSGRPPNFVELSSMLEHTVGNYTRVFIAIDALDECESDEGLALVSEIRGTYTDTPLFSPDTPISARDTPCHVQPCIGTVIKTVLSNGNFST
jgi:hypothetical protein